VDRSVRPGLKRHSFVLFLALAGLVAMLGAQCRPGAAAVTPTPTKTRVAIVLPSLTATETPAPTETAQPGLTSTEVATSTQAPGATSSPSPTSTPLPSPVPPTATPADTPQPTSTPKPAVPARPLLAPQAGGEWDMEAGFVPGSSPLEEDCPGWAVAAGWRGFVARGTPASSCLNENKNMDNVYSGDRSQEVTFDFIQAEAGIYRRAQTIPGHRYRIEAWGKHVRSDSPVELSLGVDLSGGEDWQGASVTWHPWKETAEDVWLHGQITVEAGGEALTVFLKGRHPAAVQGGATLFDDVRVIDLGP
jgi:hypothetical protein